MLTTLFTAIILVLPIYSQPCGNNSHTVYWLSTPSADQSPLGLGRCTDTGRLDIWSDPLAIDIQM